MKMKKYISIITFSLKVLLLLICCFNYVHVKMALLPPWCPKGPKLHLDRTFCVECGPAESYVPPQTILSGAEAPIDLVDSSPVIPRLNPTSSSGHVAEGARKSAVARHQKTSAMHAGTPVSPSNSRTKSKPVEGERVIVAILRQSWYYKSEDDEKEGVRTYNEKVQCGMINSFYYSMYVDYINFIGDE